MNRVLQIDYIVLWIYFDREHLSLSDYMSHKSIRFAHIEYEGLDFSSDGGTEGRISCERMQKPERTEMIWFTR